jgi:hypothetical protein
MEGYLGELLVDVKDTPYAEYTPSDWVLEYIHAYGQIDGEHHKAWVLDQVVRILNGAPVIIKLASWANGQHEYRYSIGTSDQYADWVAEYRGDDGEGNEEYGYDEGTPP